MRPFDLNEHGLWCPCCGNLISTARAINEDGYQAPEECRQCGFPEDIGKVAAYHGMDDDPDPEDDEPDFECPRYWISGKGGGWFCPLQGSEDCDWECPE